MNSAPRLSGRDSQGDLLPLPNGNACLYASVSAASPFARALRPGRAPSRYFCQPHLYTDLSYHNSSGLQERPAGWSVFLLFFIPLSAGPLLPPFVFLLYSPLPEGGMIEYNNFGFGFQQGKRGWIP